MSISKIVTSGAVLATLFVGSAVSAQTYYYGATTGCANISADLSYGSRGAQVTALQTFLVSQNYPGGGSWMVTGFYGQATVSAVRNFQQQHGLPVSGSVDASTRAAMCSGGYLPGLGGTGYNTYNTYPYNNNQYPYNNTFNYSTQYPYNYSNYNQLPYLPTGQTGNYYYGNNYNYGYGFGSCGSYPYFYPCTQYGSAPHLTSLSVTTAPPGAPVTVYGTGFEPTNTVYVGGTTLSNIQSPDGSQLTFTVPGNANGSVSVSVGNARGTSNALTLTTGINYPTQPPYYPYPNPCLPGQGGYGYGLPGQGYNCPPTNTGTPTISYLLPNSGAVGTSVTVYGTGFSATGNTVHFGNGIISNKQSFDGRSISFTVPSSLSGYGYQPIGLGTYDVSVTNSYGVTSNTMPFTITSVGTTGSAPSVSGITGPTSLQTNVSGTWTVTVQNPSNAYLTTTVNWGDSSAYAQNTQSTYAQGSTALTFSHAYSQNGSYTITFTVSNGAGQSSVSSVTVSVSGSGTGSISLNTLNPSTGHIGTQVVLTGSGFDALNNTVHFGVGGTMHIPSTGGVIYYTIPSYVSPCDVSGGGVCTQYIQQVTPGSYQIYVTSPLGNSGSLTFQVQ